MTTTSRLLSLPTVLVGAVIAAGVLFRVVGLDSKVFWHDEVYTKISAAGYQSHDWDAEIFSGRIMPIGELQKYQRLDPERGIGDTIAGLARDEPQHPPLYYVLARLWVSLFGDGVATLRSLTVLLSLFGLPAIYWLCRELYESRKIAWTGVMLYAVSPFFVLYAQEAREYALWSVLILAASAALLRALHLTDACQRFDRSVAVAWGTYASLAALAFYTSFSTVAMAIAHVTYVLVREKMRLRRSGLMTAGSLAVTGLLFLPWAVQLSRHFDSFRLSMAWASEIVIPTRQLLGFQVLNISRPIVDFWPGLDHGPAVGVALLAVALAVGALAVTVRRAPLAASALVLALVLVPFLMLSLPDLLFGGIRSLSARYFIPAFVGLEVALAFALGRALLDSRAVTASLAGVLLVGVASCVVNARRESVWTKGVSFNLPVVAQAINASPSPIVISNRDHHNPGNLHALSNLLESTVSFQVVMNYDDFEMPEGYSDVFLFSPTDQFRNRLEAAEAVRTIELHRDVHTSLWRVEPL